MDVQELNINNSTYDIKAKSVVDTNSGTVKMWTGTKEQYEAIVTKDATTLYNIVDDTDTTLTLLELLFPVGAVYFGTMSTCPLQTLGVGTWQALPPDKVIQIAGTRGAVGDTLNESLPNYEAIFVNHYIDWSMHPALTPVSGAIAVNSTDYPKSWYTAADGANSGTYPSDQTLKISPSISNNVYQDNAPVQPDAYLLNGWRRIA